MRYLAALPILLLGAPAILTGQSTTLSSYVAADGAVSGMPVLVGITVGREASHLGVRWSTAVDAQSTFTWSDRTSADGMSGLFTTEIEGLLFPLGSRSAIDINPYGFAGAGVRMTRDALGASPVALWSYGVGTRAPITSRLSAEAEMRNRRPIMGSAAGMPNGTSPGWEVRMGLTVRIGRGAAALDRRAPRGMPVSAPSMLGVPRSSAMSTYGTSGAAIAFRAIDTADDHLGVTYRWGGNSPGEGFDCSGFVRYVFLSQGIELPRVSRDQALVGAPVPLELSQLQPGDLLAFASKGRVVDHIAIYVGDNRIIHSSASGGGVRYDDLTTSRGSWYLRHMVAARRVVGQPFASR